MEILVAMVILIGVFTIGGSIVVRMQESSKNWRIIEIESTLRQIRLQREYQMPLSDIDDQNSDLRYNVEMEKMVSYNDRHTVKIYAIEMRDNVPIDSLIYIEEINE